MPAALKITIDEILEIASNYDNQKEFRADNRNYYQLLLRRKKIRLLHEVLPPCKNYTRTNEEIRELTTQFKTVTAFQKQFPNECSVAYRRINEDESLRAYFFGHVEVTYKPRLYTDDEIIEIALNEGSFTAFSNNQPSVKNMALKYGLIDKIEELLPKANQFRTLEEGIKELKKYKHRCEVIEFDKPLSQWAYKQICKNPDLEEVLYGHMTRKKTKEKQYTDEEIIKDAQKYNTISEWSHSSSLCTVMYTRNDEKLKERCTKHMKKVIWDRDSGYRYKWRIEGTNFWKVGICVDYKLHARVKEVSSQFKREATDFYYEKMETGLSKWEKKFKKRKLFTDKQGMLQELVLLLDSERLTKTLKRYEKRNKKVTLCRLIKGYTEFYPYEPDFND